LYLLGGLLAPVGGANTLRVTAHYHAMLVGGVTTAFMGVVYRILQQQGFPVHTRAARWQVHLFGLGVLLTVAALLVAASAGLPRKAYLGGGHPWQLPFVLLSAAAALSAAGGVWFLSSAAGALWSSRRAPVGPAVPATSPGR
jgi:heme/copper-type cytochrome/quinol oxidase subunit 1